MINILDYSKQFKSCYRKSYEAYVCKPPVGSCVLNKFNNSKAIYLLQGRAFLSAAEVLSIQASNPNLYRLILPCLVQDCDFVISIAGVLQKVSAHELYNNYEFSNHSIINQSRLLAKSYICEEQNGVVTPIHMTLSEAYKKGISEPEKHLVISWFKVLFRGSTDEESALYIDNTLKPKFINYFPCETEDYCVVVTNGDEHTAHFVSVDYFRHVYNQHGWSTRVGSVDCIEYNIPEPLFEFTSSIKGVKTFAIQMQDIIDDLYKDSIAIKLGILNDIETEILSRNCLGIMFKISFGDSFFLAFKEGSDFYFASGYYEQFTQDFNSNIDSYIKYLKSDKCILFSEKDFKLYKDLFIAFMSLHNSAIISNYRIPRLTASETVFIKNYTGAEYGNINNYLRGEKSDNDFNSYIQAMYISDIINRSSILKNSWHFRGLCLDKEVAAKLKPNDVIEHKNFASSSISALITYEFVASARSNEEGILLVFRNTAKKHGIFIDSLSAHRGKEQEVLFNVGSDFKLIRKLGYYHEYDCPPAQIWLAELVENKDCKLRKYSYQSDIAEKLVATIQMSDLMKSFYISYVIDANMWDDAQAGLVLKRYNSEDITIDIRYNMGTLRIEFCGLINEEYSFKIKEKGYNHMFDYIYGILKTRNITSRFSTSALSSFSEKFMFDLISCFTNNHYIITDQSINKGVFESPFGGEELFADLPMKTVKESRLSEFTLLTADAKPLHIELELSLSDDKREILADLKVPVGNRKGIKHFSISVEKRFELFDIIFTSIVSKFNLDPSRRIKHIFSLVSGYYESYLDFRPTEQGYKCSFDDKVFEVLFEGESIRVVYEGASVLLDYYEDIYSAASEIQAMI